MASPLAPDNQAMRSLTYERAGGTQVAVAMVYADMRRGTALCFLSVTRLAWAPRSATLLSADW